MKCIVCEEPNRFAAVERDIPQPQSGEALVRIRRIGICGTDLHAYRGRQPYFSYPRVLGHELACELVESDSTLSLSPGDCAVVMPYLECGSCVACRRGRPNCCTQMQVLGVHRDGGMREFMTIPADKLVPAPSLSVEQMAIVECLAIGAHAVRRADVRSEEFALVVGAGPIGLGAMQFAAIAGAKVIAMDVNERRLAYCRDVLKIPHTVDARQDAEAQLAAITDGEFPTAVFDATGNPAAMNQSFSYVAHSGRLVFISLVKADITFSDPEFHKREMTLLSSRNATRADFEHVIANLAAGRVETDTFITHRVAFDGMIGEFESWLDPNAGVIKAMVAVE